MFVDIGIMVGSSADGIDLAGAVIQENSLSLNFHYHKEFPLNLQKLLKNLADNLQRVQIEEIKKVESQLTDFVCQSLQEILEKNKDLEIHQVSYHGYTLCHMPEFGLSWQLGDVQKIADTFKVHVVHDFRQEIVENGGKGAPLIPNFHHWLTKIEQVESVNYLNIGGISNISVIDKYFSWGSDVGPGNCLSDQLTQFYFNKPFDKDGQLASQGEYSQLAYDHIERFYCSKLPELEKLTQQRTFCLTRQDFQVDKLIAILTRSQISPYELLLASNYYVTERIAQALKRTENKKVIVFGGGVLNKNLMQLLQRKLPDYSFEQTVWHPQVMESLAFAWLGYQRLKNNKHHRSLLGTSRDLYLGVVASPQEKNTQENKIEKLKKIFY